MWASGCLQPVRPRPAREKEAAMILRKWRRSTESSSDAPEGNSRKSH